MKIIKLLIFLLFPVISFAAQDVAVESLKISLKNSVVTVGTAPTALPATALSGRKVITVENLESGVVIYIGNATVTANEASTGGYQLINIGDSLTADLTDNVVLYGIVASGTAPAAVLEVR